MKKITFGMFLMVSLFLFSGCGDQKEKNLTDLLDGTGIIVSTGTQNKTGFQDKNSLEEDDFKINDIKHKKEYGGEYKIYTKHLDKKYIKSGYNVIMNFHDSNNTTCNMFQKNVQDNIKSIPKGFVIIEVDVDKEKKMVKKHNIKRANTFVFFNKKGKEEKRIGLGILKLEELFMK